MWIMLIKKLPTKPSPPRMSIFWSTPWPKIENADGAENLCKSCDEDATHCNCEGFIPHDENSLFLPDRTGFGRLPNWIGARKIRYNGNDIRVFPHEFSVVKRDNMLAYVMESHELVLGESPKDDFDTTLLSRLLEKDEMEIRDAAMVEGCDEQQAKLVALGMDFTLPDAEFPPVGWYRCKEQYANVFCEEWQMKE